MDITIEFVVWSDDRVNIQF